MSGVQHRDVAQDEEDLRLDRWFKRHFPQLSHGRLEKFIRKGHVRVDGKRAKSNQRLEAGQSIRIPPLPDDDTLPPPARQDVDPDLIATLQRSVLYKDKDVLVLNKPAGVAVQGGSGVSQHIDGALDALTFDAKERPRLVHRLDKDTAGVLVLARSAKSAAELTKAFRRRETEKVYWAVVIGRPEVPDGQIEAAMAKSAGPKGDRVQLDAEDGKRAITDFRVISTAAGKVSWLELKPLTGRTHQLRVHCEAINTPILGDGKYGGRAAFLADLPTAKQLHLFARSIRLPRTGKPDLEVTAPVPPHMTETFSYFGFEESEANAE
jgi:23S rRNA pseudouridine955/2504/2580 synthase